LFAELRRKVKKKSCWIEFARVATLKNERDVPRLKTPRSALYNLGRNSLPDAASNPGPTPPSQPDPPGKPRRWRIVAAGLLLLALALVVIYTSRSAFYSPLALVVVAAIGIAALLLQLRLRRDLSAGVTNEVRSEVSNEVRAPIWINVLGLMFAIAAVSADLFHSSANLMQVAALGSVVCFAISGTAILRALRKKKI
jgi:hypothetical protein